MMTPAEAMDQLACVQAAREFFAEIMETYDMLSDISNEFGAGVLRSMMYIQNAILADTVFDLDPDFDSNVVECLSRLPSNVRWMGYIKPIE
jgi:hypothetical protein